MHLYTALHLHQSPRILTPAKSYLDTSHPKARFYGNLDIKTLGGAGFASQRTTGDDRTWNLAAYDGILIQLARDQKADGKQYTFVLKDEILPLAPDGREQSTISYEYDFKAAGSDVLFVPWSALRPTYRGKEKEGAPALKTGNVKRFSIMIRRFVDRIGWKVVTVLMCSVSLALKMAISPSTSSPSRL